MAVFQHAFRTDPRKAADITNGGCLLGYGVILIAVPLAAAALSTGMRLAGEAAGDTALAAMLGQAEGYFRMLSLSYLMSWLGALLSIPLVLIARKNGLFGWAGAILAALAIMELLASGLMGGTVGDSLRNLGPAAATLGLVFWVTVRLANPRAFHRPGSFNI